MAPREVSELVLNFTSQEIHNFIPPRTEGLGFATVQTPPEVQRMLEDRLQSELGQLEPVSAPCGQAVAAAS